MIKMICDGCGETVDLSGSPDLDFEAWYKSKSDNYHACGNSCLEKINPDWDFWLEFCEESEE